MKKGFPVFHLALDSGAHSVYNQHFEATNAGLRGVENTSFQTHVYQSTIDPGFLRRYLRNPKFLKYVDAYGAFVQANANKLDFTVTLDIIADGQASYNIWHEYQRAGLKMLPVFHYGEDFAFLKKYMDETDYIGITGRYNMRAPRSAYTPWARKVFKLICDKHGRPNWKVHGFAVSAFEIMVHFPWHSIDSSSPFYIARNGALCVPRSEAGIENYFCEPAHTFLSERREQNIRSYHRASPVWKKHVSDYLESLGLTVDRARHEYVARDVANLVQYIDEIAAISARRDLPPIRPYVSGKPGSGIASLITELEANPIARKRIEAVHYLGSFFQLTPTNFLISKGLFNDNSNNNGSNKDRRATVRAKTRPTLHRHG